MQGLQTAALSSLEDASQLQGLERGGKQLKRENVEQRKQPPRNKLFSISEQFRKHYVMAVLWYEKIWTRITDILGNAKQG